MTSDEPTPATNPRTNPMLVVAVDLSPESMYALDLAAAMAAPQRAALRIIHVHHAPPTLSVSAAATVEFEKAETEIDGLVKKAVSDHLAEFDGEWSLVSRSGNIAHELLAEAEDVDAGLIVVGHRSHGTVRDLLLGSVASNIVHHSRRSVLVAIEPKTK